MRRSRNRSSWSLRRIVLRWDINISSRVKKGMLILYHAPGRFASNGLQKVFQPSQDVASHNGRDRGVHLRTDSPIEHPPRQFK